MGAVVRTLYDTKKFQRIFISGSSASLLSQDMGVVLTGRHITFSAAPFSFREYLRKRGWEDFAPEYLAYNKDKLLHYLSAYLETGGFPETVELDDFGRKQVLTSLYNNILSRDISSRYGASFEITDEICRYMLTNPGALTQVTAWQRLPATRWRPRKNISVDTTIADISVALGAELIKTGAPEGARRMRSITSC